MFALEIQFQDGVSKPEVIFVRRPQALIGASDFAHVVIEDMREVDYQLRIIRELGRSFRCKPEPAREGVRIPDMLEGSYEGSASLSIGPVTFNITALDTDLLIRDGEPPDRAGVRVLRQSCATKSPKFPAVVVKGAPSMTISFVPDQPLYIGRARECALRLDSADISARHARIGYESGSFWIEDLGSTNGTFVDGHQISGRVALDPAKPVVLGHEVTIAGVADAKQLSRFSSATSEDIPRPETSARNYPVLISVSEVARPAKLVLPLGETVSIGRDPSSDMWLGAPHVSRQHCTVTMTRAGDIAVTDTSTNGTAYDEGVLNRGDVLDVRNQPRVLNFGGGLTVALCFSDAQEKEYIVAQGAPDVFSQAIQIPEDSAAEDGGWIQSNLQGMLESNKPKGKGEGTRHGTHVGMFDQFQGMVRNTGKFGKFVLMLTMMSFALALAVVAYLLVSVLT